MRWTVLALSTMALAVLGAHQAVAAITIVDTKVNPSNGHTYHLLSPSTWTDAEAEAARLGGHLATIRNAEEDEWIWDTFGDPSWEWPDPLRMLWIGLNDAETPDTFVWSSGEPVMYTNWARNQPSGYDPSWDPINGIKEDYVQMGYVDGGNPLWRWNDMPNIAYTEGFPVQSLQGVVEVVIPEPSTLLIWSLLGGLGLGAGWWRRRRAA